MDHYLEILCSHICMYSHSLFTPAVYTVVRIHTYIKLDYRMDSPIPSFWELNAKLGIAVHVIVEYVCSMRIAGDIKQLSLANRTSHRSRRS